MPTYRNIGGVQKLVTAYRKIGATWKLCVVWRNIGGVWKVVSQMTASSAPDLVSGNGGGIPGTVVSNATTVSIVGGIGPYTYAWSFVSGDNTITIDSAAANSTTFSKNLGPGASTSGVFKCTVTDFVGQVAVTNNVGVDLTN